MTEELPVIDFVLKWLVAPFCAWVVLIYRQQQMHERDIAVIRAQMTAQRESEIQTVEALNASLSRIYAKLDNIETTLRKP